MLLIQETGHLGPTCQPMVGHVGTVTMVFTVGALDQAFTDCAYHLPRQKQGLQVTAVGGIQRLQQTWTFIGKPRAQASIIRCMLLL